MLPYTPPKRKALDARKLAYTPKKVAKSVKTYVKKAVASQLETKRIQSGFDQEIKTGTALIQNITAIAQGNLVYNRMGNVIAPFHIRGKFYCHLIAACAPSVVRIMILKFKECDGTLPTMADILPTSNGSPQFIATETPFDSEEKIDQRKRKFQVLYDKVKPLCASTDDGARSQAFWSINKKLVGKTLYTGNLATDEGNNQIFLCAFTDAPASKTHLTGACFLSYKDA